MTEACRRQLKLLEIRAARGVTTQVDQDRAITYAKFVDLASLKKMATRGSNYVAEAKAAVAIVNLCIVEHQKTGQWPDRDIVGKTYFAGRA